MPRGRSSAWTETAPSALILLVLALAFAVWSAIALHVGAEDVATAGHVMAGFLGGIAFSWWRDARAKDERDWIGGRTALQPPPVDENFGGWRRH